MALNWSDIKELFYAVGATAGVLALLRPVVETKFQRDHDRLSTIRKLIDELDLIQLVTRVESHRQVPDREFEPFRVLAYDRAHNHEGLRFSGPVAKHLLREVDAMIAGYEGLRQYIQVDEWEPLSRKQEDGAEYTVWVFNKAAFRSDERPKRDYAQHLTEAAEKADEIRRAYQRLQIVGELHFFEVPLAGWLLRRRFKSHQLV